MAVSKEIYEKIQEILTNKYSDKNYISLIQYLMENFKCNNMATYSEEYSNFSSIVKGHLNIGEIISKDNKKILVASVLQKNAKYVENSRSLQRGYAKKLITEGNFDGALIAYYSDNDIKWRFSFVELEYETSFKNNRLKFTEKLTPAKRYSYLVGEGEPCHTAIERISDFIVKYNTNPTLKDIEEVFSVENVTTEFFKLYSEKFQEVNSYLEKNETFQKECLNMNLEVEKFSIQFTKKLLGQIVFLYFLQRKGWLGVNVWPTFINEKEFKNAFYSRGEISKKWIPLLYKKVSEDKYNIDTSIFKQIEDEDEEAITISLPSKAWGTGSKNFMRDYYDYSQKNGLNFFDDCLEPLFYTALNTNRGEKGYWPKLHCRMPFLSGELFEPLNNYDWKYVNYNIPDTIFSNGENGILDIFDRYNFTMSEDEPMEKEIAIDPEMLGKVFESLLDVSDRKAKGEFYTPREIVHYMCQQSLIEYIVKKTNISKEAISDFILYGDLMRDEDTNESNIGTELLISKEIYSMDNNRNIINNRLNDIDNALKTIKVADPAVGSGAFPLGMLNEIVKARENITYYLTINNNSYDKRILFEDRDPYILKRDTIKNSIFAVDLEPSAVDITQLRLWLALVIDDKINPNAQTELDGHRNPIPLPNLECNILCGNSLIDEFRGLRLIAPNDTLKVKGQTIYNQSSYDILINQLINEQDKLFYCKETMEKINIKKKIEDIRNRIICTQLKDEGANNEIIKEYEETGKYTSKPFILWQLDFARVFKENDGFDVIIGNPPYIGESGNKDIFRAVATTEFGKKYYIGKMDFWYFFTSKAIELLKNDGVLAYIAPNNWTTTLGGRKMRNHIIDEMKIMKFITFGDFMVFESASQQTMIFILQKNKNNSNYNFSFNELKEKVDGKREKIINEFLNNKIGTHFECNLDKKESFDKTLHFIDYSNLLVINKIKEKGDIYLDAKDEIAQGIVFPQDKLNKKSANLLGDEYNVGDGVFLLDKIELEKLELDEKEKTIIKPFFNSNQIKRWNIEENNEDFIIYTSKDIVNRIEEYPKVKKHLDEFSKIITSDNKPYGLHRARNENFFIGEKIISTRKCEIPTFSYANFDTYVSQTYNIIKTNRVNYKYLLGILNSKVIAYWLRYKGKMQGNHYQVDAEPLSGIPICLSKEFEEKLIEMVNQKLKNVECDDEINDLVYKIYNLNNDEINVIENSYEEIRVLNGK